MLNHFNKSDTPLNGEVLSIILNHISDVIFICDPLGDIIYSAGNITEIFGYSASEINQISQITQLIEAGLLEELILAAKKPESLALECNHFSGNILDKFGNHHWVEIKIKKITLAKELFLLFLRDISQVEQVKTELKHSRQELEKVVHLRTEQLKLANLQLEKQIIERQRTEVEIQNTVERLMTILETVAEGITFGEETGKFELFNSKMEEITGYTKSEANSCENFLARLYPEPREYKKAMTGFKKIIESGKNIHRETIIKTKTGQEKTLLVSTSLVRDGDRNLFLSAYRDITHRQAAERALAESEARKKAILAAIPDALFCMDREGIFLEFIPAKQFHPFVTLNQFIGKKITNVLPENLAKKVIKLIQQTLKNQTTQLLEYQLPVNHQIRDYEVRMAVFLKHQVLAIVRDISDRKQAERAVQQQMQWNQLILQTTMDGFFRFDAQGNILKVNSAFMDIMQYSEDKLLGMKVQDLLALDTPEEIRKHIQAICFPSPVKHPGNFSKKPPKISERLKSKYRRSDGAIIHVELSVTVTQLGNEKLMFAFVRDISDLVSTGQALIDSQRFIQKITDTVPVLIYIYDLVEQKNTYFNSQISEILGYDLAKIQEIEQAGPLLLTLLHPEDSLSEINLKKRWESVKDGEILQTEMRIQDAEGVWRNFQCEETLFLRDANGLPKQILGAGIDITEQKKNQQKLLRLSKAVASTSDAIAITDLSGNPIYINPAFIKLFGYELAPLISHKGLNILYADSSLCTSVFDTIKQGVSWRGEVKMQTHHRDFLDILLRADAIKDESGKIVGFVYIYTDISDRKRAQEQLAQHAIELARFNAELEQFAYVASHDLQEPLRIITSYSQLISRRYLGKLDEKADKYIQFVVKAAQRMQQLIEDLLEFSRLGSQKNELGQVECEAVLNLVLENLNLTIFLNDAIINHEPLPVVLGDHTQLVQLFQNLIVNGIKYRTERSPIIHISATRIENYWRFAVSDNGIGIAPEFFERIFTIFQRLHTREEYPGTGIGLAICKKIVQRHRGEIWVQSQVGAGSTFYFTLPAVD
ncbi:MULTISPECIES: PAS domain S-box protein [Planktothricoides]|uniref:histidine kinase n=1 Tax=Planktothricoides raciborskii FACHB-1370 TaxID=2949576 RepID=A0ABR8EK45_9CYAN|nr:MULTISPECIES: PAS domain S-box protein [Planktothricoides]MBD2545942.1 PAS domain S-box protein [Planktothricoides raciborskii FACHB-1370]MBD2584059.1 PAS domain S-box protein [Planktothricoides raciborskii FACHB-1261]